MTFKFPSIPNYRDIYNDEEYLRGFVGTYERLVFTEKLDGVNVMLHNGNVYTRDNAGVPASSDYLSLVKKHHAWKTDGFHNSCIWGEDLYAQHSCQYMPISETETFRVFMVSINNLVIYWDVMVDVTKEFNIVPVKEEMPIASVRELRETINRLMTEPSSLGGDLEGLVVRKKRAFPLSEIGDHVFKVVRRNHVKPNAEHWKKNWKPREIIWGE